MTAGTNQPATRSARRWIGARDRCASRHHLDDARQHRIAAYPFGADDQRAGLIQRAADDMIAGRLSSTGMDSPVTIASSSAERPSSTMPSTGDFFAGANAQAVADDDDSSATSSSAPSASQPPRGLRRKIEQRADRAGRLFARAQFQHLAEQHEHGDDRRRLEIDGDGAVHAAERGRKRAGRQSRRQRYRPRRRRSPSRSA